MSILFAVRTLYQRRPKGRERALLMHLEGSFVTLDGATLVFQNVGL